MYEIAITPIQRSIQIYDTSKGQSKKDKTRYTTSMLLTDLGLKECRVHFVSGELNHDINKMVFRKVKELGYVMAQMEVPEGTPASRFGEYQYTRNGLDRYKVNLND